METGTKTFRNMYWKEERKCPVFAPATVSIVKDRKPVFPNKKKFTHPSISLQMTP
jgi:hypothetical protein